MKSPISRIICTFAGLMAVLSAPQPALADDSEVFLSSTFTSGDAARPNVLFIMDTSGSMSGEVTVYDPAETYTGPCTTDHVYWETFNSRGTPVPSCNTTKKITLDANRCRASYNGMLDDGMWSGRVYQLNSGSSSWVQLADNVTTRKVECESDDQKHGDVIASTASSATPNRARNGSGSGRWGTSNVVTWSNANNIMFYSANYLNWYHGDDDDARANRLQIVQRVAKKLITELEGVNLGIMRYSVNGTSDSNASAQGGMVTYPISELTATTKQEMIDQLTAWTPGGFTPLSETYYEAHQYLSGGAVKFGNASRVHVARSGYPATDGLFKSVAQSRTGNDINSNTYKSPMEYSCQKTFIVYLTDGLPTQDESSTTDIKNLPDFATDGYVSVDNGGNGDDCPAKGPSEGADPYGDDADGRCMVNLAAYLQNHDLRSGVLGKQNVTTYVIGFGDDIAASADYLDNIAKAGGGKAYTQSDAGGLTAALKEIFSDVAKNANSTFVAPTVAVNAFNRTRTLNSLYVSVFAPTNRQHWPGNVKKYQLIDGVIYGAGYDPGDATTHKSAVNSDTGFFADGTSDLFGGNAKDGPKVSEGGAASKLPEWDARKVYTDLDPAQGLSTGTNNRFAVANTTIKPETIGLPANPPVGDTQRDDVIKYTLGLNLETADDTRKVMGDPMHSRPAVAIYGGTEASPEGRVYVTTNDGMLQSLDMNSGVEQWAFIPKDMLARLGPLEADDITANRTYGVDGDVRVFKYDVDGDGIVETGDRVYVLFSFGRGGSTYYALDVTSPDAPTVLWKKNATDLPMLGQAWSPPVITRVNVNTTAQTDTQKLVIIFGAGYDASQDAYTYAVDGVGNGVYMLELKTGNLLWSAGKTGSTANWKHPYMNNSIPAEISVLDINSDGYADRLYFGDMGGRIWRLDFWHGQVPNSLASGGLLATLGAGHLTAPTAADARRFYYAPDVSLVTPRGSAPYLNLAIGSGYRGHPLDLKIRDRFYSVRDYQPFNRRTNTSFNSGNWVPIKDGDLVDVTDSVDEVVGDGEEGWRLELREGEDTWRGEKVLGEAITVNGVIFFPTFTPVGTNPANPCLAATLNRTWAVYLDSARPFGLLDGPVKPGDEGKDTDEPTDRYKEDGQGGIAPGTAVVQSEGKTICLKGVAMHKCVQIGDVTRTFWERRQ